MRIHQAELLTNTQLQPFREKGGNRLSNNRAISLCLLRDKKESFSTSSLKLLEQGGRHAGRKIQLVLLIFVHKTHSVTVISPL